MLKRYEGASVRPQALVISPEAPYPPVGGGPMRTASLIDYLARRYNVDVITFREHSSEERRFPPDRVRNVLTLDLPYHSKSAPMRAARNLRRFVEAKPPLFDRYSGFEREISQWVGEQTYPIVMIEHFWCAGYAGVLRDRAKRLVLDLHNVESALQTSSAAAESWPLSWLFERFGDAYADLERALLPEFDDVLVTSPDDAKRVESLATGPRVIVYPNALPKMEQPLVEEENAIAFSGNLEYHANSSAIEWFARSIWPRIRERHPELEWRLIGKNPGSVRVHAEGMHVVGLVEDAVHELARAKVAVVPLRAGSGTRFKVLEAWAACRAVVSTTMGAEGLGARHGEHLLIADDEPSFAEAVDSLLQNAELRERLGSNGRKLYLERFTVEAGWRTLESAGF